jgi:hypothetical protein
MYSNRVLGIAGIRNISIYSNNLKKIKMPNIRNFKKEIDNLIYEVISDCLTFGLVHPLEKQEELGLIINEAVGLRNDLFKRINASETGDDPKSRKKYFHEIEKDLLRESDKLWQRLSLLTGKVK